MKTKEEIFTVGGDIRVRPRGVRGVYTADFQEKGKHRRRSLGTRNRREAEKRAWRLYEHLQQKIVMPESEISETGFDAGVTMYVDYLRAEGRSPKTLGKYQQELTRCFNYMTTERRMASPGDISPSDFDLYRRYLIEEHHLEPYTIYNLSIIVKQCLAYLESRHLIKTNRLKEVVVRKPRRRRHPAATPDQVAAILAKVDREVLPIVKVLSFTGMRLGEAAMLHAEHVDLKRDMIRLFPIGQLRLKTESAQREIPLHPVVRRVLVGAMGDRKRGLVFRNSFGRPINPRTVNVKFIEAADSLGMVVGRRNVGLTVHALRRFFKTTCYDAGTPKPLIDRWLGHADDGMDGFYYDTNKSNYWMSCLPFNDIAGEGATSGGEGKESA